MDTPSKSLFAEKFNKLCNFLEKETVGTELVIYGTAGLMLIAAYARRKPLVLQFKKPSHIPERIIKERVMHTGVVKGIQQRDQDTLLLINHRPLIPIFMSSDRVLPVKLPGVQVNANGYSWLQDCVVGRKATFIPLTRNSKKEYAICQLCLVHPPESKGKLLDVSETLLKLRFAKYVADPNVNTKKNDAYYKHLQKIEVATASKESWISWAAARPWLWQAVRDAKLSILPKEKLLPELVR